MATTPGVEAVDPQEAPEGPPDNRSGDTAADACGLDGAGSSSSKVCGPDTEAARHSSSDSGGGRSCKPGESDGTSRRYSGAGDVVWKAASTECLTSTCYSSPSVSAGRGSARDVAGASGSSVGSCENGGTGDNAAGAGASCATEVAAVGGGTGTGGAGSTDTGKADVGGAAAYGNASAEDVAGASREGEAGSVERCVSKDGGTGDNAIAVCASWAAEVAAAGGGTETGGVGCMDTGKAYVGGAAAYGNASAEDVAGASRESEAGSVERCVSKDGGTGEAGAGVGASGPTRVVRVDGTGGGATATGATGSATTGNAKIGCVSSDQAAATGAGGGKGIARSVAGNGRTGAARVEPAAVPSSVHYGIYVNNIPLDVEEDQLRALFEPYGEVLRLKLVKRPEYTTFVFAYVLLDSDDNTKRAIQELDGTVLNGQPLKMEPTFGRTTHIFGIGEGTPYNRSRAALEQWRQNRDAQQANGNRGRQPRNDDQWRRGYNDRSNCGDWRFGDRNCGNHRYGDRFNNNDRRFGGGNRFDSGSGNRSSGGNHRYGGYRHNNCNNQGRYNNRYDNDGNRGFSRHQRNGFQGDGGRYQRDGFHGDGGGGHRQHGYRSSGGINQGGYRSSDDGQRHQYGRYQDRYGDSSGRRGGGCNDGGYGHGGNRGGDDDGYASNYERCLEAMRRMRDAWTRRLERLAAEGDDGEEWPTFDELLELVRHAPYNIPMHADDVDDEGEEDAGQPVFWWARDSIVGGGGDDFGPEQVPGTVLELLRWRHGDDAVAQVSGNADGEESEEDGGVCLIVGGGADGEQGPRSPPHEDSSAAVPEEIDSGDRDVVGAGVDAVSGEADAEGSNRDEEARLTQGDWPLSIQQCVGEKRQPRAGDDSESKLAERKKAGEMSVSCEEERIEHSAATSISGEGDTEGGNRDEEVRFTQGDLLPSVEQHAGEEQQPRGGDDSVSKLAEEKNAGEMSVSCEEESGEHSAETSSQGSVAGDGDDSENTSDGPLSTAGSSGDIVFDSGDVSANDYSEGSAEDDTLQSELASGRFLSLPGHLSRFIENAEHNYAGGQAQGQQWLPQADSGRKDADTVVQPSRTASMTDDGAGKGRGTSMDTDDITEEVFENVIAEAASAGPTSYDFAKAEEHPLVVVPEAKSGNSESNLSVAAKLLCAVETLQNDSRGYGRRERRVGISALTTVAERMAAASSWNRAQRAATVREGADDNEDDETDDERDFTSDDESFCTEIIVRMKNAKNAVHLAARRGAAATESKSVQATQEQRLPSEPRAAKFISELLMTNESGDVRSPAAVSHPSGFEIGRSSESIGVREALAQTDLRYKEDAPTAGGEEASSAGRTEIDEMRALLQDETEGAGGATNMAAGGFGGGAKPKVTRPFQHAKRRQRQKVADSVARWVPPDQTLRTVARHAVNGGHESDAHRKENQDEGPAVVDGVQDLRAREGGVRRALRRKRDFEDDSETDDELSDSEVDDRLRPATHWARVGERNAPDIREVDPPAVVEDGMLSVGGRSGEVAARQMEGVFLIEHSAEDGGASKGTGGPTGRDPKCGLVEVSSAGTAQGGGDAVLEASGRGGPGEDDPEIEPAMTSGGFEEGTQDGVGGAQQTTTAEQGAAQSSRAGGDSSETGRRDAVDTRRPSRASRRDEEIECEPSDGQ